MILQGENPDGGNGIHRKRILCKGDEVQMGKRTILIAAAAGLCITGLCVKSFVGDVNGRDVPVTENIAAKEDAAADNIYERPEAAAGRAGGEETQAEWEEKKTQAERERKDKPALPETVILVKPIVKLNDEEGIWGFYWDDICIRVDEETSLTVISRKKGCSRRFFFWQKRRILNSGKFSGRILKSRKRS